MSRAQARRDLGRPRVPALAGQLVGAPDRVPLVEPPGVVGDRGVAAGAHVGEDRGDGVVDPRGHPRGAVEQRRDLGGC